MPHQLANLYIYLLKYGFRVKTMTEWNGAYCIFLEKWLPPQYEPDRYLQKQVTIYPKGWDIR